jgi:hypothetical protein
MQLSNKNIIILVVLHALLGMVVYSLPVLSKIYGLAIITVGVLIVIKNRNKSNEVLFVCAYIIGSEVFLRMTSGNVLYEFGKYGTVIFLIMGMYYSGISKTAIPYWIFLLLLIPGIVIATQTLSVNADMRKTISFNISGPFALAIAALYTYKRQVTANQLNKLLLCMGLPIVSCAVYLFRYTPNIRETITGTASSFAASGGFGPNQVSTILGLGMFIFFSRLLFDSRSRAMFALNIFLAIMIGYRGLVTFSRGGMITGISMLIILIVVTYFKINSQGKYKLKLFLFFFVLCFLGVWSFSSLQTGGLIDKRYSNEDAVGRTKESRFSGRENISASEIGYFMENPVFGIGVARGAELREEDTGNGVLSHNEITRMLAEHGSLGIAALLILFFTPLILSLDNPNHMYLFAFVIFWLLTINHAAMRLAAPGFVYALSLLKITPDEKPVVHRE